MASVLQTAFAKDTLLACAGYLPKFVDPAINLSFERIIPPSVASLLPEVEGDSNGILKYTNLSVLYNSKRRVPFLSAYNIDGSNKSSTVKRANSFRPDPRINPTIQLSQTGFYDLIVGRTEFEIGHMAANNEMAWGDDAQTKSYQTFHFTNSVPQAEKLNTGIWKTLETYIINEAATVDNDKRINVFTGPLLMNNDPKYVKDPNFQIPLLFFKVILFMTSSGIFSTAFMMSHEQKMIEDNMLLPGPPVTAGEERNFDDFKYKKVFQVNIKYLEDNSGLKFSWPGVKTIQVPDDKNQIKKIRKIKDSTDAAEAEKKLRAGIAPAAMAMEDDLTPHEIRNETYRLNLILPD